jgi:hypothetical protein
MVADRTLYNRFWKKNIVDAVGGPENAVAYRMPIYLLSASIGE